MMKYFIIACSLFVCIIMISCNDKNHEQSVAYAKSHLNGKVFIPTNIKKDTIEQIIYGQFTVWYFKNDTTVFKVSSLNEFYYDSLCLAVDAIAAYKGNYKIKEDTVFAYLELTSSDTLRPSSFYQDTLRLSKVDSAIQINYKGKNYRPCTVICKESFERIDRSISIGFPLSGFGIGF